jgi:hypothetical protein
MSDLLKENGLLIGISALCLLGIATQLPAIQANSARRETIAQTQAAKIAQGDILSAEQAASVAQVEIANDRYDSGVEIITDLNQRNVASTILEGQPIVAGAYAKQNQGLPLSKINPSHFLGRDVVIGDCYGTTAVMRIDPKSGYAVAGSIAVTNDRERMAKACTRRDISRPNLSK